MFLCFCMKSLIEITYNLNLRKLLNIYRGSSKVNSRMSGTLVCSWPSQLGCEIPVKFPEERIRKGSVFPEYALLCACQARTRLRGFYLLRQKVMLLRGTFPRTYFQMFRLLCLASRCTWLHGELLTELITEYRIQNGKYKYNPASLRGGWGRDNSIK